MYTSGQVVELLTKLVEDDQLLATNELGRNTVDTLNRLGSSDLKSDLEQIVARLRAARQQASEEHMRTRWDCVACVADGYLFEHCLEPDRGDVTINRSPLVLGPIGALTDLKGNTVALVNRRTEAELKGVAETAVKHNLLSAILESAAPEDVQKAVSEMDRRSGQPPAAHALGWPAVAAWGGIALGVYWGIKDRALEEVYWRSGYEDVKRNQEHVRRLRRRRDGWDE